MKKWIVLLPIALIAVFSVYLFWQEKPPIKIGFITPLSKTTAVSYGEPALKSAQLAVEEINAQGGVSGRKIELLVEDGQCNTEKAKEAAQKLILQDKVKVILGGHCSTETLAIAPIAEENQVIVLASLSTSPEITKAGDFIFRNSPSDIMRVEILAELLYQDLGIRKLSALAENLSFPKSSKDTLVKKFQELGGKVLSDELFKVGETDFISYLNEIKTLNPDAIFLATQGPETCGLLAKQIKALGIEKTLVGNQTFISPEAYTASEGTLEDVISAEEYFTETAPKTRAYLLAYKAKYGEYPPYRLFQMAASYDAVYIIRDALEICGEDTTCIRDFLYYLRRWEGAAGLVSMDQNGDPIIGYRIVRMVNGNKETIKEREIP